MLVLRDHGRNAPDRLPDPIRRGGDEVDEAVALLRGSDFALRAREQCGSSTLPALDVPEARTP